MAQVESFVLLPVGYLRHRKLRLFLYVWKPVCYYLTPARADGFPRENEQRQISLRFQESSSVS